MNVVVVSPHLDDAVLSVGATMRSLSRREVDVQLVTVFAGDPEKEDRASYWDAKRGLTKKTEVFEARRGEDQAAAAVLGVEPVWLPFDDGAYVSRRDPDEIWARLRPLLYGAAAVLLPGWPLVHADHRFVTAMVMQRLAATVPILLYAELPYGARPMSLARSLLKGRQAAPIAAALGSSLVWRSSWTSAEDRAAKRAAVAEYRGEVAALGLDARLSSLYDSALRRELLASHPGAEPPALLFGAGQ